MKKAFVVMGTPSSGTRLMGRLLSAAGCVGDAGNKNHTQHWDNNEPVGDLIVIRRHTPVRRKPPWAKHENIVRALEHLDYCVHVVIMSRDWYCTVQSMLRAPHADSTSEGYEMAKQYWRVIFDNLPSDTDFTVVSYESLVRRPKKVLKTLFDRLGLVPGGYERIYDANVRYYDH